MPLSVGGQKYAEGLTAGVTTAAGSEDFDAEAGAALLSSIMRTYMEDLQFPAPTVPPNPPMHEQAEQAMYDSLIPEAPGIPFNEVTGTNESGVPLQVVRLQDAHKAYTDKIHELSLYLLALSSLNSPSLFLYNKVTDLNFLRSTLALLHLLVLRTSSPLLRVPRPHLTLPQTFWLGH